MYDAIVGGARWAGAPAALLLARRGYRVLPVGRAEFPSDTVSTHWIGHKAWFGSVAGAPGYSRCLWVHADAASSDRAIRHSGCRA